MSKRKDVSKNSANTKETQEDSDSETKKKKIKKNYSVEGMQAAMDALNEGQSVKEVASKFGIPAGTLYTKMKNKPSLDCRKIRKTVLSPNDEKEIAQWVMFCSESGIPVTKSRLLDCVKTYIDFYMDGTILFKNNRPGTQWYCNFLQRHPNVGKEIGRKLACNEAFLNKADLQEWFKKIKFLLSTKNLLNIDDKQVFSLGECVFSAIPKEKKILKKAVKQHIARINLTVLFAATVSGEKPPPMILFDSQQFPKKTVLNQIPKGWGVGKTEHGLITAESLYVYVTEILYEWLKENNYDFPIVLFINGSFVTVTLPLFKFCKENHIELVMLYPSALRLIQPLDTAIFQPMRESYKNVLRQWINENSVIDLKQIFDQVLQLALDAYESNKNLENNFHTCGLYPFKVIPIDCDSVTQNHSGDKTDSTNGNASHIEVEKHQQVLEYFETNVIAPDLLKLFEEAEAEDEWNSHIEYKGLFKAWLKIKKLASGTNDGQGEILNVPMRTSAYDELNFEDVIGTVKVENVTYNEDIQENFEELNAQDEFSTESNSMIVDTTIKVMNDTTDNSLIDPMAIVSTEMPNN